MPTHARTSVLAAAVTLAVGALACGGGDDTPSDRTGDAETASDDADGTTTTTPPTPEELAVAAYEASWEATFQALDPPQEIPEIAETHTGEAFSETVNLIAEKQRLGHRIEGEMETHPVVVSATSDEVVLDDCAVENSVEYDPAGAVVDTAENAPYNYGVTVVNEDDVWKVSDFERREEPCTPA